jgi:hypothetical protein
MVKGPCLLPLKETIGSEGVALTSTSTKPLRRTRLPHRNHQRRRRVYDIKALMSNEAHYRPRLSLPALLQPARYRGN